MRVAGGGRRPWRRESRRRPGRSRNADGAGVYDAADLAGGPRARELTAEPQRTVGTHGVVADIHQAGGPVVGISLSRSLGRDAPARAAPFQSPHEARIVLGEEVIAVVGPRERVGRP